MASYPSYTISDVATFSGRPEGLYNPAYTPVALANAFLLFKLATCLTEWPEDADHARLASNAVLELAEADVLAQPYKAALASPFSSETIGSYSYSRTLKRIQSGEPTGMMWFDMAVQYLGVCETGADAVSGGSLQIFDVDLPVYVDSDGSRHAVGPMQDPRYVRGGNIFHDPSGSI